MAGARVLVVEADKTFVVDREQVLDLAERYGIIVVARKDSPLPSTFA